MSKRLYKDVHVEDLPTINDNPWGLVYQGAITQNEFGSTFTQ